MTFKTLFVKKTFPIGSFNMAFPFFQLLAGQTASEGKEKCLAWTRTLLTLSIYIPMAAVSRGVCKL